MPTRRPPVGPKILKAGLLCLLGVAWFGIFMGLSASVAPSSARDESEVTKSVQQHFTALAEAQRKALDVNQYYSGNHVPGMLDARSEEHTSELQSLRHLVCRLL